MCNKITIIDSWDDLCLELGADVSFLICRIVLKQCISKSEIFSVCNSSFDENEEDNKLNSRKKYANNMFLMINAHGDTLVENSIADDAFRLLSACNNMFLLSEMHLKIKISC